MPLYDIIGIGYAKSRPADYRIVSALCDALGLPPASTVLDVGAGTAKYARALADRGFSVLAIEPSGVMRSQSIPHPSVRMIAASAEEIPLAAGAADGAFVVLALHHFSDRKKALVEILRVIGQGPLVIFSFEPRALARFWLAEYFPRLGREIPSSYSELGDVAEEVKTLTGRAVRTMPFPLPRDFEDRFAASGWATPESYLDAHIRSGISSFSLMSVDEADRGLARLSDDLASGAWDRRHGWLRAERSLDVGYRFIIAEEKG
jgi:SAM-dependent methyltransferase